MKRQRTTISVDQDTWRVFEALVKETGMKKNQLARLSIMHLADCKDVKRALSALGYDTRAITSIIKSGRNLYLSPLPT